ncbi:PDZ domain-containing protein [Nitritalea halalkaliphila]|uniref:PDZ domain-containing protein n=1 Tax=Nitritalea halalkaliphila TaxID=590849 RepID=UPI0002F5B8CB|nr:PDZ domain-containing protein [Nitritalea halalkaliphila]
MNYLRLKTKWVFSVLLASSVFFACNEEIEEGPLQEEPEENSDNLNRQINDWTFAVMNEVYYWLDEMGPGGSRASEPPRFLQTLMVPQDRYTLMRPSAAELEASLEGRNLEAGYEFNLILAANGRDVLGAVTYIKANSPAASTELRRGDFITAINGVAMDTSNFRSALANIRQPHTITYAQLTPTGLSTIGDIEMQVTEVAENPNFLDTVLVVENEKIGYFVYNFFAPGREVILMRK